MSVRIEKPQEDGTIPIEKLEPGQIAEIVRSKSPSRIGRIVLRNEEGFHEIGTPNSWSAFDARQTFVRILLNGTRLIVEDNE